MPILRNMAIKHKLILIIMLACITGLVLAGTVFIIWEYNMFRISMVDNLSTQAEMIAENCKASLTFQDAEDAKETLQALRVAPSIVFGCIYTSDNKLFATYYRDYARLEVQPKELKGSRFDFSDGYLTVHKPIVLDGDIIGWVCLRSDMSPMYAMLKRNISIIIAVLFLSSLAAFLMSSRLQNIISKPILSLAEIAKAVSEKKDYSTRAIKHSNDELGSLIEAFNEMLEQIQQRDFELVNAKEKLEVRVQERTTELTTANEQLTQEIAVRKKAEEQLRRAEEKYRTQFEGALDAIFVADADTGILVDCNPAAMRLVGRQKSELVGQPHRILHPPERIEGEFVDTFKQHLREKQGETLETQVITKDGKVKEVAIKASLIEVGGKKLMQGIFRDITISKKAELALKDLNEKLVQSNQQLQEFTYVASHDLREPTRKITSFGELLLDSLGDKLNDDDRENLHFMIDGADRMQQMIEALLTYSRVTTKGVKFEQLDLNEIVEQLKSLELAVKLEESGGTVSVPEPLPTAEGDATQIRQLLQNLISNGVKYHKKDVLPEVTIRAHKADSGMVRVEVQDNGIGIKKEQCDNVFIMFRRLHSRDEYEGTGIGLAVCKRIIERHSGEIGIESTYGQGSTFWFTLPSQKNAQEQSEPAHVFEKPEANIN